METKQFKLNDKRLIQFKSCKFQVSQLYQAPHLQYQCEDCPALWLRKCRRLLRASQTKIQVFVNKCIHYITQILGKACQAFLKDSQSVDITFWDFYRSKKLGSQRCCQFILAPEIKQVLRAFILPGSIRGEWLLTGVADITPVQSYSTVIGASRR